MKRNLLLFIMSLIMCNAQAVAQINKVSALRYTDLGNYEIQLEYISLLSNGEIKNDSFSGICAIGSTLAGFAYLCRYCFSCPEIDPAVLASISGKPVTPLDNFKSLANDGRFRDKIIRSNGIYPIDRVPYVIIGMKP